MEKTVESEERKSRREVLKALGAAAAGTVAGSMLSAKEAEAGHGTLNAISTTSTPAIHGENTGSGIGVIGTANGIGVLGTANGNGVQATGNSSGVNAFSSSGIGVIGLSDSGIGVLAGANAGTALQVDGTPKFSTAGFDVILANQDSAFVPRFRVTALSHITVTLTGDPGQAGSAPGFKPVVVWVERDPGTGFTVHLSRPVRVDTPFTYLMVEPLPED